MQCNAMRCDAVPAISRFCFFEGFFLCLLVCVLLSLCVVEGEFALRCEAPLSSLYKKKKKKIVRNMQKRDLRAKS